MSDKLPALGTAVVTADGHLLGRGSALAGDCFKVDKPMAPDEWIALDMIKSIDGDVRLSVTRDQLEGPPQGVEHLGFHVHRET